MIEDEELRNLYQNAAEEHLQQLEAGLLHLEKQPQDSQRLDDVLREAHTLKGDSRMLGVNDVETLIHQIESVLGKLKEDSTLLQQGMSDRLYQGLDAIRQLVREAVTGEPSGINTFQVLALLMGSNSSEEIETPTPPAELVLNGRDNDRTEDVREIEERETVEKTNKFATIIDRQTTTDRQRETLLPPHKSMTEVSQSSRRYHIESVRVETRDLDALMTQTGELTVSKIRMVHHLGEIEQIASLWEDWSRYSNRYRLVPKDNSEKLDQFFNRNQDYLERLGLLVNQWRSHLGEDIARLETISEELESRIRTLRLLPLSTIFNLFPRLVRDLAKQQKKQVELIIEGGDTKADKRILEEMKDPLMHMIRNSIDHGLETPEERERQGKLPTATLRVSGYQTGNKIIIEVVDNGRGLDVEKIKKTALERGRWNREEIDKMTPDRIQSLIFIPGFSTRKIVNEISGRGVGLDVVRTNIERLKGTIEIDSIPGQGCTLRVQLPTTLATAPVLIFQVSGYPYALPVDCVKTTLFIQFREIFQIEGRDSYALGDRAVSVVQLAQLLELNEQKTSLSNLEQMPCIIVQVGQELLGLIVDELSDQQDAILKPQSKLLKRVRNVTGATILSTGEVCIVLNPRDLIKSAQKQIAPAIRFPVEIESNSTKALILLAEDAIATRTQEKRILETAGYDVITAVDGLDAYNKLRTSHVNIDAVVSDVQMPNLDGLSLAARIRQHPEYNELPIILVTSLASDEDKRRGAEAGANAYLTKGAFNPEALLETLQRLI